MNDDQPIIELPKNLNAERTVLGAAMIDNDTIYTAMEVLEPEQYYGSPHQEIAAAIYTLHNDSKPVDLVSVSEYLDRHEKLDLIGGRVYLATFEQHVLTTQSTRHYCELVLDAWQRRQLIKVSRQAQTAAHDEEQTADKHLAETVDKLNRLSAASQKGESTSIADIIYDEIERIRERSCGRSGVSEAIPSGIPCLDEKIAGFFRGEYSIVSARTSIGKTSFADSVALNVARSGTPVLICSNEMSTAAKADRFISQASYPGEPLLAVNLKAGLRDFTQMQRAERIAAEISILPLDLDYAPRLTPRKIASRVRTIQRARPDLGLVIIDYVQRMRGDSCYKAGERVAEYEDISLAIAEIAGTTNVHVMALSQLNREMLLKGYGWEEHPDLVMEIHRPEKEKNMAKEKAELVITKHRNGWTGTRELMFMPEIMLFKDWREWRK